jgi:hypothetical protein
MRFRASAAAVLLCLGARPLAAKVLEVTYSHAENTFRVAADSATPSTTKQQGSIVLGFEEGDILVLTIDRSLPGVLVPEIVKTDVLGGGLSIEALTKLGLPQRSASVASRVRPGDPGVEYEALRTAIKEARESVAAGFSDYENKHRDYVAALARFRDSLGLVPGAGAAEIAAAMTKANLPAAPEPTFANDLIGLEAARLAFLAKTSIDIDRPMNVTVRFKSVNALIEAPGAEATIHLRDRSGWRLATMVGFGFSGLIDDHYTARTIVDAPATTHREALRERRDQYAPDVVFLVHIVNRIPIVPTFGVGLNTGSANGRFFAGASARFGTVAALTGGMAAGKVKRLSRSVDPHNVAEEVDPEASRVDVLKVSWFVAISFRPGGD